MEAWINGARKWEFEAVLFWNECLNSNVPMCLLYGFRRSKGGWSAFRMTVGQSWEDASLCRLCVCFFFKKNKARDVLAAGDVFFKEWSHGAFVSTRSKNKNKTKHGGKQLTDNNGPPLRTQQCQNSNIPVRPLKMMTAMIWI